MCFSNSMKWTSRGSRLVSSVVQSLGMRLLLFFHSAVLTLHQQLLAQHPNKIVSRKRGKNMVSSLGPLKKSFLEVFSFIGQSCFTCSFSKPTTGSRKIKAKRISLDQSEFFSADCNGASLS